MDQHEENHWLDPEAKYWLLALGFSAILVVLCIPLGIHVSLLCLDGKALERVLLIAPMLTLSCLLLAALLCCVLGILFGRAWLQTHLPCLRGVLHEPDEDADHRGAWTAESLRETVRLMWLGIRGRHQLLVRRQTLEDAWEDEP